MSPLALARAEEHVPHDSQCASVFYFDAHEPDATPEPCDCDRPARVLALAAAWEADMVRACTAGADACMASLRLHPIAIDYPDCAALVAALEP